MILYFGWRILAWPAQRLPRPWVYRVASVLMTLVFHAWRSGRAAMRDNVRTIAPPTSVDGDPGARTDLARRQMQRYGEYLVDALRLDRLTVDDCLAALETDLDVWPRLRAQYGQRPLLFALMHFGNWDVGGGGYAAACGRSSVLVEPLGHPRLDAAIQGARDRIGMTPAPIETGVRSLLATLRADGTAAVLFDRPLPPGDPSGVVVTFLGRPCRLPSGMARLALASGAQVAPLAVARTAPGKFRFRALVDLDFHYTPSGDRVADVQAITQGVLDVYAGWVRDYPDQWYQFRPFFLPRTT